MNISRRKFMGAVGSGAAYLALATSFPKVVWAKWSKEAFTSEDYEKAVALKYPGLTANDSTAVKIKAPAIAENGAVVPISVKTDLPDVKSISLFVVNNPAPLAASFNLGKNSVGDVSIRLRMGTTSQLVAMVEAGGKLYKAQKLIKVTIGGCGG